MDLEKRVEWISMMHKQNLNGRETEDELFEAGIKAGLEDIEDLLKVCQNALRDVKAMNEWMVEKGHHGYTLLEQDLEDVLKKTLT